MFSGASALSKYLKTIFESQFPQSHLLTAEEFLKHLEKLEIRLDVQDLEYYDQKGILRPVLRFRHQVSPYGLLMWSTFGPQILAMKENLDRIEFPEDGDFRPWKDFETSKNERIVPYYHPFQFIQAHRLAKGNGISLGPKSVEEMEEVDKSKLDRWKKRVAGHIEASQKAAVETWISLVGFLILLEESYGIIARNSVSIDPYDPDSFRKWKEWRSGFSASDFLASSRLTIDDIKKIYDKVADAGHLYDPLAHWYPLQELIKRSMKQRLKGSALLAQEYYDLAKMVKAFIKDVSGEVMLDPDDKWDSNHKNWKPMMYGDPVDYRSPQTNRKIRDHYFIDRPPFLSIVFEGDTEELLIRKLFNMFGDEPENVGYHLYNAHGSGNMDAQKLGALVDLAKMNQMEVYLIIDNDRDSQNILKEHLAQGNIREGMYTIWKKDFEYDNFLLAPVISKVNQMLTEHGYNPVSPEEVERRMTTNGNVLMHAIDNVARKNNSLKKLEDMISKPKLSEELVAPRIAKIEKEHASGKWNPTLPIEKVLHSIFQRYPFNL